MPNAVDIREEPSMMSSSNHFRAGYYPMIPLITPVRPIFRCSARIVTFLRVLGRETHAERDVKMERELGLTGTYWIHHG